MYGKEFKGAKEKFLVHYNPIWPPCDKGQFSQEFNNVYNSKSFVVIKVTWDM